MENIPDPWKRPYFNSVSRKVHTFIKKALLNFTWDKDFLMCPRLSLPHKMAYLFRKYYSIIAKANHILFLSNSFFYDNRFVPALLETYPKEIILLDQVIGLNSIHTVLDVGANIGQWAYTLKYFFPHLSVYSFEPNTEIFSLLKMNAGPFRDWHLYNYALGNKREKRLFYYCPSASAEGSFFEANLYQNYLRNDAKSISVSVIKPTKPLLHALNIPLEIDLVKIDVEGAEMEALKSLKDIRFKYLAIEVSVHRQGGGSLEKIRDFIEDEWGIPTQLLYYDSPDSNAPCGSAIFLLERGHRISSRTRPKRMTKA